MTIPRMPMFHVGQDVFDRVAAGEMLEITGDVARWLPFRAERGERFAITHDNGHHAVVCVTDQLLAINTDDWGWRTVTVWARRMS